MKVAAILKWCRSSEPQSWRPEVATLLLIMLFNLCVWSGVSASGQEKSPEPGTLTPEKLAQMGTTAQLDINLIRLHPEVLENKAFMVYFISLNNCSNRAVQHSLDNELDYPRLAAYYESKEAEIVSALPPIASMEMYDAAKGTFPLIFHGAWGGGQRASNSNPPSDNAGNSAAPGQGTTISLGSLFHKKLDDKGSAKPAQANVHHVVQIEGVFEVPSIRDPGHACPAGYLGGPYGILPGQYMINVDPMGFDELPMPEAAARAYIDGHPPASRGVELAVYVRILDKVPEIVEQSGRGPGNIRQATLSGAVAKISVIDTLTRASLGNLFDDHTIPNEAPKAAAIATPPAATGGGLKVTPLNPLISITTAATVMEDNMICNWPVPADQDTNLHQYLHQMVVRTQEYQLRERASVEGERSRIAAVGRNHSVAIRFSGRGSIGYWSLSGRRGRQRLQTRRIKAVAEAPTHWYQDGALRCAGLRHRRLIHGLSVTGHSSLTTCE
jgi:hypothetical protein